jgi:hypothetical protein
MSDYEYKVVPAPTKGRKAKGRTSNADRFAVSVEDALNQYAADGWEYLRAELLPSDERSGLTGSTREWRNVLIFRRALPGSLAAASPEGFVSQPRTPEAARTRPEDFHRAHVTKLAERRTPPPPETPEQTAEREREELFDDLPEMPDDPGRLNPLARAVRLGKRED